MLNKKLQIPDEAAAVKQLFAYFNQYIPLQKKEREELTDRVVLKAVKRRQFILQPGNICRHYSFVMSGCLRMYGLSENGAEHNLQFAAENDWIADISSFHSEKESQLNIEAIEPSIILQVNKADLVYLYHYHPKFDRIFRVIIENKFIELQDRVLQNIGSTAEERFHSFLAQYPRLAGRLPSVQIASYLGITPEFLSKLRRLQVKK